MFDPNYPPTNALIESAPLRGQFNGLKTLIDAVSGVTGAVVDAVITLPPGSPAAVGVSVSGTVLHLTFDLPQGAAGEPGQNGSNGTNGSDGSPGAQGPPGEVSASDLNNALATTSANSNAVGLLNLSADGSYNQGQLQDVMTKLDELINTLRRVASP